MEYICYGDNCYCKIILGCIDYKPICIEIDPDVYKLRGCSGKHLINERDKNEKNSCKKTS